MNASMKYNIKMLNYDRTVVSQTIDVNKQVHQECDVCHYCYFLNYSVKFEPNV